MINAAAAVTVILAVASFQDMASKSSLATISAAVEIEKYLEKYLLRSKINGWYFIKGTITSMTESAWFKI